MNPLHSPPRALHEPVAELSGALVVEEGPRHVRRSLSLPPHGSQDLEVFVPQASHGCAATSVEYLSPILKVDALTRRLYNQRQGVLAWVFFRWGKGRWLARSIFVSPEELSVRTCAGRRQLKLTHV